MRSVNYDLHRWFVEDQFVDTVNIKAMLILGFQINPNKKVNEKIIT